MARDTGEVTVVPPTRRGVRAPAGWLTLVGVLLLALNLRAAIAGLAPLLPDIQVDLSLSRATGGLLTTLPVVCFAVLAPVAALLARRVGTETTLLLAMVGIAAGSLVRTAPGTGWLVAGTTVIGIGIAVANILVPGVVKQHFAARQGLVTGLTTVGLTGGAALAAAVSAPLAHAAGLGWRGALLVVGALAAVAAMVWLPQLGRHDTTGEQPAAAPRAQGPVTRAVLRSQITWQLAIFMGMQSLAYYTMLTWLPDLLREAGVSASGAGWALATFNLLGIGTALLLPALADRRPDQRGLALATCAAWGAGLLGLLVAPSYYLPWAVLTGLAQGAGIGLALTLIVLRAGTPATARELSATVQAVGYLLGAVGPVLIGVLRDSSGGWDLPLAAVCLAIALMAAASFGAGRDRQV